MLNISASSVWFFLLGCHRPDSHLDTQAAETLHFSASISCEIPNFSRYNFRFCEKISFMDSPYSILPRWLLIIHEAILNKTLTFSYISSIIVRELQRKGVVLCQV